MGRVPNRTDDLGDLGGKSFLYGLVFQFELAAKRSCRQRRRQNLAVQIDDGAGEYLAVSAVVRDRRPAFDSGWIQKIFVFPELKLASDFSGP